MAAKITEEGLSGTARLGFLVENPKMPPKAPATNWKTPWMRTGTSTYRPEAEVQRLSSFLAARDLRRLEDLACELDRDQSISS